MSLNVSLVASDTSQFERQLLEPQQQFVKKSALAELGFVEFGIDVVMIKDEGRSKQRLVEPGQQKNGVRRVACLGSRRCRFCI